MGLAATIIPLLFGRLAFAILIDSDGFPNDVYAFSSGVLVFSVLGYLALKSRQALSLLATSLRGGGEKSFDVATATAQLGTSIRRAASVVYTYLALGVVVPTTLAIVLDLYLLMPLHAYRSTTSLDTANNFTPPHAIRLLHDWTLGLLYLRLARRILMHRAPRSRLARAVTHIWRDGALRPDAALATRAIVLPTLALAGVLLCLPVALARLLLPLFSFSFGPASAAQQLAAAHGDGHARTIAATRAAYPAVLACALAAWLAAALARAAGRWRRSVRDDIYLVGERLHDFGGGGDRGGHARGARAVGGP